MNVPCLLDLCIKTIILNNCPDDINNILKNIFSEYIPIDKLKYNFI